MLLYCTTKNVGLDHSQMIYLGLSLEKAEEVVGEFKRYRQEQKYWPNEANRTKFVALPPDFEFEFVRFYQADMWWCSIVMIHVKPEDEKNKDVTVPIKLGDMIVGKMTIDGRGDIQGEMDAGLFGPLLESQFQTVIFEGEQ